MIPRFTSAKPSGLFSLIAPAPREGSKAIVTLRISDAPIYGEIVQQPVARLQICRVLDEIFSDVPRCRDFCGVAIKFVRRLVSVRQVDISGPLVRGSQGEPARAGTAVKRKTQPQLL